MNYTYPKVIIGGGKAKMTASIKKSLEEMKKEWYEFQECLFKAETELL